MKPHPWFRAPYDRYLAWKSRRRPQPRWKGVVLHVEQLEDCTLLNGGGHQAVLPKPPKPDHGRQPPAKQQPADPLYVLDANNDVALPSNGTPITSFSNWSMSLEAQVSGASVTSYSWDFSRPPTPRTSAAPAATMRCLVGPPSPAPSPTATPSP
jgi:hypothetical protein